MNDNEIGKYTITNQTYGDIATQECKMGISPKVFLSFGTIAKTLLLNFILTTTNSSHEPCFLKNFSLSNCHQEHSLDWHKYRELTKHLVKTEIYRTYVCVEQLFSLWYQMRFFF